MKKKTFRIGGIHPPESKLTADVPITPVSLPTQLTLLTSQSIGAPSVPLVAKGDRVKAGQMIARAGGFVSAPVHTPADGTVRGIEQVRNLQGLWQQAIVIDTDAGGEALQLWSGDCELPPCELSPSEIVERVAEAGIVGLGGATFPTRVKLSVPEGKKAEYIIINGAECEPYLTCDDRLMRSYAAEIADGARLIARATDAHNIIIGIEENKPEAIEAMRRVCGDDIELCELKKKYPQGGEKQLIAAVTGREVPMGGLPVDAGCIVDNVATAYAVSRACRRNVPLTERIVTVTGPSLTNPGNFLVPLGTPVSILIELAGGLPDDTGKVIAGGPMMGRAVSHLEAPSTKGLSGVLVLPRDMSLRPQAGPCIRCSRCVDACPMGLEPYLLMLYAEHSRYDDAARRGAMGCIECGSCSYTCPSARPILDYIRLSKIEIRKNK